jgi:hypothetical protein
VDPPDLTLLESRVARVEDAGRAKTLFEALHTPLELSRARALREAAA